MENTANKRQRLRTLLPLTSDVPASLAEGSLQPSRHERNHAKTACEPCRKSKAKCFGTRPTCRRCIVRGSRCHYLTSPHETRGQAVQRQFREIQSRMTPYEELFEILKSASEEDSQSILERIRAGDKVETLVNHVAAGDLLLQLSVVPESQYRYELPYISYMPASLVSNKNPYLHAKMYQRAALYPVSEQSGFVPDASSRQSPDVRTVRSPVLSQRQVGIYESFYLKPFHAAEIMDPQLADAKISPWTTVCSDDVLMRKILGVWLQCEYQFTAAFQKDLFLEDMAAGRGEFCSSLLVNAVLGYACICYPDFTNRAEYWNPQTLTYRFIAEAKRLWELHAGEPKITTIQAGMIFNVFYNLSGLDEIGQVYRLQAIDMARSLNIFDSSVEGRSDRLRHGMAYAAWALFMWETLTAFSFIWAPVLLNPPSWQLPDPSENAEWYGEIWVKYPLNPHRLPSHFGQIFKARSEFRVIMNEACQISNSKDAEMNLSKAYGLLSRLDSWYDRLPSPLLPKSIVLPGHMQLHMYYHHLKLTVFKPLLEIDTTETPSPQQIVADATKYLQTLIRLYYLRHGFDAMDLFIVIPLMLAASDAVDSINKQMSKSELETLRSTLILVAKGLYCQRRNHYLAEALFRVIRGRMPPCELVLFNGILNIDDHAEIPDMAQAVRSHWPVSVVKKKEEIDSHILKNLVENYAHLKIDKQNTST